MKRKIERGQPLSEQKGSLDYMRWEIGAAWRKQFDPLGDSMEYINETFFDHVIVRSPNLKPEEYYFVPFTKQGNEYVFAERAQWEVVELAYTPQTREQALAAESRAERAVLGKRVKIIERRENALLLEEGAAQGSRRVRINEAIVAGVINANGRRYALPVIRAAVDELSAHLRESAGNGRALLLGEAEHPTNNASGRGSLLETVIKWDSVDLNEETGAVSIAGQILETSKGKDILALMEGGVLPGGSLRGWGMSKTVEEGGQRIQEVTELHLTGYDLVLEPSFLNQAILESKQDSSDITEDAKMKPEELKALIEANPDLFKGMIASEVDKMGAGQMKALEESVRKALGVDDKTDLSVALKEAAAARRTLEEQKLRGDIDAAITEATKGLPYNKELNTQFAEELRESVSAPGEVKGRADTLRKRYDKVVAGSRLGQMGFAKVQVTGPVIEEQTGAPAFAKVAVLLNESMRNRGTMPDFHEGKAKTINERAAKAILERFDQVYAAQLMAEAARFEEANTTSDLSLPYSVSRAIVAAVWPRLVATSIFDAGTMSNSPEKLFFEKFVEETGMYVDVTAEVVAAPATLGGDNWAPLANKRIKVGGTITLTNSGATVTYVENTDFIVDYANGRIYVPATGSSITANQSLKFTYQYEAIRKGENQPIERAKVQLASADISALANRLAASITREAVVFSQSQIGYDVVQRVLANLASELARKIDQDAIYKALASVRSVSSNSGGAWNGSAAAPDYNDAVLKLGKARVKVANRMYEPTFYLASSSNSDLLANWAGFTAAGARADATLDANGYVGRIKGLPLYTSPMMPDNIIVTGNRELVQYRVFKPFVLNGPYPTYDQATMKLIAADQYYLEQFDATESLVPGKGAYITVT